MIYLSTLPSRDIDQERALSIAFSLSPAQAGVLSCLLRVMTASQEDLNEFTGFSHSKVFVSRARQKLKEHGVEIKSKADIGYWLEPDHKEVILDLLKPYYGEE